MTPMLAKQVENLAPANIFLSADSGLDELFAEDHDLVRADTRADLLTADLVMATRGEAD